MVNNYDNIKLPQDINELEYLFTYEIFNTIIDYFFYEKYFITLDKVNGQYEFIMNGFLSKEQFEPFKVKTFSYEWYKYETVEIKDYLLNRNKILMDSPIMAVEILMNKYLNSIRKKKIKNLLTND